MRADRHAHGWLGWSIAGVIVGPALAWLYALEERLGRERIASVLLTARLHDGAMQMLNLPATPPPALLKPPIKRVLEFLHRFPTPAEQTLEQWEQGLAACTYQAQEYAIGFDDVRDLMLHSSMLLLAGIRTAVGAIF